MMKTKQQLRAAAFGVCIAVAVLSGSARAQEVPLVNGEHWTKSTEQQKKAYLIGIANILQLETAYGGTSPAPDSQSIVPRMVKGLKGHTLDSVHQALDRWYAANPGQQQRTVIDIIWFEMVVPGLKKAS